MKKIELILLAILVPLDYLMLVIAGLISYFFRFNQVITDIRPVIFSLPFNNFLNILLLAPLLWLIFFAINGLYSYQKRVILLKTFLRVFSASTAAIMVIIVAFFFNQRLFNSRLIVILFWLISMILVFFGRWLHSLLIKILKSKEIISKNVIIIGQDNNTKNLISEFKKNKKYGLKIIEHYQEFSEKTNDEIISLMEKVNLDQVIQADLSHTPEQITNLINFCQGHNLTFMYTASLLETRLKNFEFMTISGMPIIEIKNTSLDGWGKIFKRIFDVIFSFIILIILLPFFLIIALIIKLDSIGPIFVKIERVGESNKKFQLYKFRSMINNAHILKPSLSELNERSDGPLFKAKNDPRITRFGKFLRRLSLDELPQFLNILKGEMSVVGPRPHEPEEVAKYASHHRKLLNIRPGITGLAAVSGRSDLVFEEEVKLDTFYIENWSMLQDLTIILKTPIIILTKKAV